MSLALKATLTEKSSISRRTKGARGSVEGDQFRKIGRCRFRDDLVAEAGSFIPNTLRHRKPVKFFHERSAGLSMLCSENETCSRVLYFLQGLESGVRAAYEKGVAVI
eukprot:GHVL01015662.1.p2 GENE.GHVL01015662.1~~GHVL01015662.1.p2  ORF type:complete len:107 (-),score=3.26 GHVL01015662.1:858-1178(-)